MPVARDTRPAVRLPPELHDRIVRLAHLDGRSFRHEVLFLLDVALADYQPQFPNGHRLPDELLGELPLCGETCCPGTDGVP